MFRIEFKTTMSKDYYLIKGCPETFIPAGKSVTIFGQLQNKRWRCVVEDADYANNVRSSNELFDPFVDEKKDTRTCDVSRNIVQEKKDSRFLPCYPLIGSLPSSVIADFNDRMNLENDDSKALYSKDHDIDGDIEDTSIDIDHSDIVLCECGRRLPSSHDVPPRLPSCSFCQYCTFPSPIQTITPEHLEQLNLQRFPSMSAAHLPTLPESPTESTIAELNMALESLAKLRPRSRPASSGSDGSCRNSWTYR
ncbi:uncharacterized protein LOC114523587 [Dendronephthya gigantea]|uniref:uncharacterized protein LOC114523587 n=1 Tax=Dendronephthya gigantea TaxID=151771 RepID=UPI00106B2EC4|nr:uncharacterized protein LOC114523587 [Dendronephthya gigantea]